MLTKDDVIISDALNHASIIDGCRLSKAPIKVFPHKDVDAARAILKDLPAGQRKLLITDGVFSMDGDLGPLPALCDLADEFGCIMMVDDAHASGVFGRQGRGTVDHFGCHGRVDIQVGTLSKTIGVLGGYVAGTAGLIDFLHHRARPFLFSTSHPPTVTAACIAALDVLETELMKPLSALLTCCLFLFFNVQVFAQEERKFSFVGGARGIVYADDLKEDLPEPDTITAPKLNSGHVLADLGINIRPNKSTEIQGMIRIRNDYGGFWGSGVSFDVRQLYIKGVIGGIVRYQLGDINYKMTKYTLWNSEQEIVSDMPVAFQQQTDYLVNYDNFYNNDNSWRQQGAAAEFALVFNKYVQELQFHGVTTRMKASNNSTLNDRLFSGLNLYLVQSSFFEAGFNYANVYDIPGTSSNTTVFHNPVMTA